MSLHWTGVKKKRICRGRENTENKMAFRNEVAVLIQGAPLTTGLYGQSISQPIDQNVDS